MAINYTLQDKFLDIFFRSEIASDFYLTGGTALARFYFHHRESIDLDLFTQNQKLSFDRVNLIISTIGQRLELKIIKQVTTDSFLQFIWKDTKGNFLKIDVVKDILRHFGEMKMHGNIRLDSLENIGSNKVLAIFGRTDAKDFIDLYILLKKTKFTLDHFVHLAKQKDLGLTEFYLANSINQVDKVNIYPTLLKPFDKKEMITFYQNLSRMLLLRIKPKK